MGKKVLVGYGIDVDAVSGCGLHGYTHEFVSQLTEEQERSVLSRSIGVLTKLTGKKPLGWTAPAWTTSKHSIRLLEEFGIEYDHSFMHYDSQMYYVPYSGYAATSTDYASNSADTSWMKPIPAVRESSIDEIPANWHLDDWPPFQPGDGGSHGFIDPHHVERFWREHFDYCYNEYDSFVFPMSIHPQVSGKPQVLLMHQRLIEYINSKDGVEWCIFGEMAAKFKRGEMAGVTIEGGSG